MKNLKVAWYLTAVVLATPLLLAMGFLGDPPALETAPEPSIRLDAVILDGEGTSTHVTCVSYDGALYLPVYRGKALITIPFQHISRVEFGPQKSSTRQVTILFSDQRKETFRMDIKVLFVGKVPFGTYQIRAKDLASITFFEPGSEPGHPHDNPRGNADAG